MDEIRWGILGCGDVTEVKSGPALQQAGRSTVTGCMRRDEAKAKDYAERHGIARWHGDAGALIADETVDAVYIATPPDSHAALAVQALRAGKPVLVEKPMALDTAECDAMADAAAQAGRPLIVAYYRRALPRFEALREIATDGTIGTARAAEIRHFKRAGDRPGQGWKLDPAVGGGGWFADMQTHTLDWLDHAFGPAEGMRGLVAAHDADYPAEDTVTWCARFGDVTASGLCAYTVGEPAESVTIHGSAGSASMPFFGPGPVTIAKGGESEARDLPDPRHVHLPFVERVVAHILDGAPNPCPPEAARRTNAALEAIYGRA